MKYYVVVISFLALFVAQGCGSSPTAPDTPDLVNGEWGGLLYEDDTFGIYLSILIIDGDGIGSTRYHNKWFMTDLYYASSITTRGDEDRFVAHLQVGSEYNLPWVYTGYVSDAGELCLSRDLLPVPERCLAPVTPIAGVQ